MARRWRKTKLQRDIEAQWGKPLEALLPELFRLHGSMPKVADALGIAYTTAYYWGRRYNIIRYDPPKVRFPLEKSNG